MLLLSRLKWICLQNLHWAFCCLSLQACIICKVARNASAPLASVRSSLACFAWCAALPAALEWPLPLVPALDLGSLSGSSLPQPQSAAGERSTSISDPPGSRTFGLTSLYIDGFQGGDFFSCADLSLSTCVRCWHGHYHMNSWRWAQFEINLVFIVVLVALHWEMKGVVSCE
jgi:hypothetical protein